VRPGSTFLGMNRQETELIEERPGSAEAESDESTSNLNGQAILMGKSSSSENPEQSNAAVEDAADEERFIAQYIALTGASKAQAKRVYMYSDIIRQQGPSCYHLE
jgi:hypothetical protein